MKNNRLGVGVIGIGGNGGGMCDQAMNDENMELVAFAELDDEMREKKVKEYGVPACKDYRELLRMPNIDLIHNGTPNFAHAQIVIDALNAGKHVFSEKPMGMTDDECAKMLAAERRSGKLLMVDFEMRFSTMGLRVKELIDSGELGEVKNIFFSHVVGGKFEMLPGWRSDPAKNGGYYANEGCHRLDLFRYWFGEEVVEVESIPNPELRGPECRGWGYQDPTCTLCFFPNGKVANLVTLYNRGDHPSHHVEGLAPKMGFEYTTSVIGTRGSVFVDFWNKYIHLFEYKEKHAATLLKRTESYAGISSHLLHHNAKGFFSDFAGRILKGQKPFRTATDIAKTMAVVFACEKSLQAGASPRIKPCYDWIP